MQRPPRPVKVNQFVNAHTPSLPHRFVPRRYGVPEACEICGATIGAEIHIGSTREGRKE